MPDDVELRLVWLRAFVQVAKFKKRTAAAKALGINQGTVTKHLQSLEKWLGGPVDQEGRQLRVMLLDDGMPAELLPAGEQFLPIAKQILGLVDEIRRPPDLSQTPAPPRVSVKDLRVPPAPPKLKSE